MARISKRERRKQFRALIRMHKSLCKAYTNSKCYPPGQVKTVFEKSKIPTKFRLYAFALYCSKLDFYKMYPTQQQSDGYTYLRDDVGELHFYGDSYLAKREGVTLDWPRTRKYSEAWNIDGAGNANAGVGGRW